MLLLWHNFTTNVVSQVEVACWYKLRKEGLFKLTLRTQETETEDGQKQESSFKTKYTWNTNRIDFRQCVMSYIFSLDAKSEVELKTIYHCHLLLFLCIHLKVKIPYISPRVATVWDFHGTTTVSENITLSRYNRIVIICQNANVHPMITISFSYHGIPRNRDVIAILIRP